MSLILIPNKVTRQKISQLANPRYWNNNVLVVFRKLQHILEEFFFVKLKKIEMTNFEYGIDEECSTLYDIRRTFLHWLAFDISKLDFKIRKVI